MSPSGKQTQITLLQERSGGTFARVYLAEARDGDGLSRIVAVKVLKKQWSESEDVLARVRDEARLLARLRHKNILRVEALSQVDGQPALVMEFVDGVDLKQLIEHLKHQKRALPRRAAYAIARDTASALEGAYFKAPFGQKESLQVVHRDVKPSNIMVSVEGEVKVLDFGTARFETDDRLAHTGALRFGSLKYMAPERRLGERGEHPSDIYALGLVIIEMLRGELLPIIPIDSDEHDATIIESIDMLTELGLPNQQWDGSLRETLARMCASDPKERLDAGQLAKLFRAFADQANGDSLDTFAVNEISQLNQSLFGGTPEGALSGSRIFVALSTSSDGTEAPGLSDSDSLVTGSGITHTNGIEQPERRQSGSQSIVPQHSADASSNWVNARPTFEPEPDDIKNKTGLLLIAVAIGVFISLSVLGGGVGLAYYFLLAPSSPSPIPIAATAENTDKDTPRPPAAAGSNEVSVAIESDDDTIQWIRILSEDGDRVLDGRPTVSGELEQGTYMLTAKTVGRAKVKSNLTVNENGIDLFCASAKGNKVVCETNDGGDALTLSP